MNIGITSSTNYNKYAITIIYLLAENSHKPNFLIIVKEPLHKIIFRNIKWLGFRATITKIIRLLGYNSKIFRLLGYNSKNQQRDYLKELALSKNIDIPSYSLLKVCKKMGIEFLQISSINSTEAISIFKDKKLDILINAGRGIFKANVIETISMGILNAHMGMLPEFRGMNVMEWSLFYNRPIGVTLHFIAKGIDTGDILLFKEIPIESGDTISDLREKSSAINVELMVEGIKRLYIGDLFRVRQQPADGKQYFVMHPRLKDIVKKKLPLKY